jgi:hypothetical protein
MENGRWVEVNDNDALQLKGFRAYITSETSSRPLLAIDSWLTGDANGDGSINVADITATVNHLQGLPQKAFTTKNADINGDGIITEEDVKELVRIMLGE